MLIPNKFSGYSFDGSRRCFGGGGGGGGGAGGDGGTGDAASAAGGAVGPGASGTGNGSGDGPGPGDAGGGGGNSVYTPAYTNAANTGVNTNRGSITGMDFTGAGNTVRTSTIPLDNLNLRNMAGMPYNQVGQQYNALLQQGFTGNDIRNALTTNGRPVSDSDYGALVQNAAMTSPTGRPMAGSDQFFQPVYNSQYQNYARPATQFDVSAYGTQPSRSPASATMSRSAINSKIGDFYNTNYRDNPNGVGMGDTLDFMRQNGINRDDFQTWGGVQNYGPQTSAPSMQTKMQQQFNPYSNNSGFNGQLMTAGYGGFGSLAGGLSPFVTGQMPQTQTPFSYQQSSYQPQMQTPFNFQQSSYQPQQQYNPYQMQTPFSYQQQSYQPTQLPAYVYDTIRDLDQYKSQPVPQRMSSGPSQAIVGRSSQMRGTPNVMRRAEGGIASLMDDVE
jgi:hypothetical protein